MKWNKSARALAVVGLTLASTVAWAQVPIGTTVTPPAPVNGGKGVNPIGSTAGVLNALSPFGGNGGPGSNAALPLGTINGAAGGTGLVASSHDFVTGTGSSGVKNGAGLCTYCHTPHKAKSTLLLWNHTLSANTFQWDVAATTSGTALPGFAGNAYNGPSAKCLSCHDGSVAIGDVGWFNESTPAVPTGTTTSTDGGFKVGQAGTAGNTIPGTTTKMVGASGNLSGNHPVAIPYPLNGAANVYNGSTTGAQLATADFVADPTANNIRLYSDVGGGAIVGKVTPGQTGIECSSCHDPHNKASTDDYFLRGNLTGATQASGYLCLQCHVK